MGKIIRNGIEYSGSYDNAISINYDNTNSGLNATTVQEGIDEIKEDLKPHANVNPIANLLTTETGYALDATQGKVLDDKISAVSDSLNDIGKLLWSGNFTEGSITVPNISNYTVILVVVGYVTCIGTKGYGGGSIPYAGRFNLANHGYRFTYNGSDTLIIDEVNKGGTDGTNQQPVQYIYGLF